MSSLIKMSSELHFLSKPSLEHTELECKWSEGFKYYSYEV